MVRSVITCNKTRRAIEFENASNDDILICMIADNGQHWEFQTSCDELYDLIFNSLVEGYPKVNPH